MNKKSILLILLDLVFVIIFNVIFFMFGGTEKLTSVWISYGFIMAAYLMVVVTPFMIKDRKREVLGLSIYSISSTYFIVEFVMGVIFILIGPESFKGVLTAQLILMGLYMVVLISCLIANENTNDALERKDIEVAYIKDSASRVKYLIGKANDKKANKAIEQVYDILHASPTRSNVEVYNLENVINQRVNELEIAVREQDVFAIFNCTAEIKTATEERNRKLRTL